MAPGCAHCPVVLASLSRLLEQGRLGRLEVVNVVAHPEAARAVGTRSVPWTRIGPFELDGLYGPAELAEWAGHAAAGTGMAAYLAHLIEQRQLDRAVTIAGREPGALEALLGLAGSLETPMGIRIGISAPEPQVRADAAHFLGLAATEAARPTLLSLLADPDAAVREIAAESLALPAPPEMPRG
ncbi:MAG: HEAT repeat domain-containing protein [Gammaproteobacteria bacterium]|nr:HEAT repeat domain-containing protein [Gammaproteobacteria bacterium]